MDRRFHPQDQLNAANGACARRNGLATTAFVVGAADP